MFYMGLLNPSYYNGVYNFSELLKGTDSRENHLHRLLTGLEESYDTEPSVRALLKSLENNPTRKHIFALAVEKCGGLAIPYSSLLSDEGGDAFF